MKIGIDGRALKEHRAGIGNYTHEIIKEINKQDKENEYYIYSNRKIYIDFPLNDNLKKCEYSGKVGTFWLYFILPKILKKDNIEVFWGTQHCLPKRNKHTKNIKYLLTIHDIALEKFKNIGSIYNTIVQKLILRKSCKNADKIIVVSEATKTDLIDILNINPNKMSVIYEGVNIKKKIDISEKDKKEICEKYNLKDENFIFFLSTIEPRKNLDTAIKAFELYRDKHKDKLKFVISGGLGWKYKKTLELMENSKYKEDIIRTGYITDEEKEYFYHNCVAFVYPSLYEGFGLPVLEAMQEGAVVITSNISSIPEVGGDAALYLNDVTNEEELEKLYNDAVCLTDKEREKIQEKDKEQVDKFSWKKCAKETLKEIKKI